MTRRAENGIWWTAQDVERAAMIMCFREFQRQPPGLTASDYWRGISPRVANMWRRLAAEAFATLTRDPRCDP